MKNSTIARGLNGLQGFMPVFARSHARNHNEINATASIAASESIHITDRPHILTKRLARQNRRANR